jgi:hypothetical protein
MKFVAILAIASLVAFINCPDSLAGDANSYKKIEKKGINFYFEISRDETEELLRKISLLKHDSTYEEIVKILGKPAFDQKMYEKNVDPETKKRSFKYRSLDYYVKRYEKDLVNERHDVYVRILLDSEDRLFKIVYYPDRWNEKFLNETRDD